MDARKFCLLVDSYAAQAAGNVRTSEALCLEALKRQTHTVWVDGLWVPSAHDRLESTDVVDVRLLAFLLEL